MAQAVTPPVLSLAYCHSLHRYQHQLDRLGRKLLLEVVEAYLQGADADSFLRRQFCA
jgi:hypothetical protein